MTPGGIVTKLDPRVDFAQLSDSDIAQIGLDAAEDAFKRDVAEGLTNNDSLAIVIGVDEDGEWQELGSRRFGPDGADFVANIDPDTGKLASALYFGVDSVEAYQLEGEAIPEGPQRFTGAVYHTARAHTVEHSWMTRDFVGAASGIQGPLDMATVYSAVTRSSACWVLKMQALHGKP